MIPADRIAKILGLSKVHSLRDLTEVIEEGLPKAALERVLDHVAGDDAAERRRLLQCVVPLATYKRRRGFLEHEESERTERLARVIAAAEYVWDGDEDAAHEFLVKPHPMLEGKIPINVAITELGAREVEEILQRLFYGIAA